MTPGLSAASTREPRLAASAPSHRENRPRLRASLSRDAAPRPDTSGGAPLPGGTWEYKHKPGTVSRQKAYDGSTQSALIFAGFGIADVAAAAVVYRRALERGVGRICRGENTMRD
ncbi:MAG: hypothetical protein K0S06_3786 [Microvirga sp.]|nr:hypothetical protein [Microvirga sp.]